MASARYNTRVQFPKLSRFLIFAAIVFAPAGLFTGCQESKAPGASSASPASSPAASSLSADSARIEPWIGKWDGPEGTFLQISKAGDSYEIVIRNLDGPRAFAATPVASGLQFSRDGRVETIHAGSGEDTGMKWLLDKKNCLVINKGEGYCRD